MLPFLRIPLAAAFLAALIAGGTPGAYAQLCECDPCAAGPSGFGDPCPQCNVFWWAPDSIAACPAGDSLAFSHAASHKHPSRLRIAVHYEGYDCNLRVGVPPESIYVTYAQLSGNVVVNDKGERIFADDSTDAIGDTRITVPSFSGCGTMQFQLYVSGVHITAIPIVVRTTDTNADGRTTSSDTSSPCDVNYNGSSDDASLVAAHDEHWHRLALHGTLVKRTSLSYVEHGANSYGASQIFWNPSGRWLSYTAHTSSEACNVFLVPSDPAIGDQSKQFTWADSSDYDPSWSPRNTEVAFGRADYRILRKGIPGLNADTTVALVVASGSLQDHGDLTPAISPNGAWVAFARKDQNTLSYHIWKVPITGGEPTQLTFTEGTGMNDQYPAWSPDGEWIIFDRQVSYPDEHHAYKVKANQTETEDTLTTAVYSAPSATDAATPAYSPDGLVVTLGKGTHTDELDVRTYVLEPALASPVPILNYPDTAFAVVGPFPVLSPRLSPDGTRLALGSRQVWAAHRNMNLPPVFTDVGGSVHDTTAVVTKSATVDNELSFTVSASDPESDGLTYSAFFLESGMSFTPATRTFSWTPGAGACGQDFYVKFVVTTTSGGSDAVIAKISVGCEGLIARRGVAASEAQAGELEVVGPNPTRTAFSITTPHIRGVTARLSVYDLTGRRVAVVEAPAGSDLVWHGTDHAGRRAPNGLYMYQLEIGPERRQGKIVVLR